MERYVVHVTKLCDLKCLYCYEQDKTSTYTWEEIKEFIDNIIKFRTGDVFGIEFLGGEPMLAKHYIIKAHKYFEEEVSKLGVKISDYIITTNGTIIDDDFIEFLKENRNVYFAISLDGHKFANQFRVYKDTGINSYDDVMKTVEKLQANAIEVGIHMVTHPYNIGYLYDSVIHLYNKGIMAIDVGTVENTIKIDEKYCKMYISEMKKISDSIHDGTLVGLHIGQFGWLKPKEDIRTYIHDSETGKLIGESYGRSGNDITNQNIDKYNMRICNTTDPISEAIFNIRETVYRYHNKK